MKKYTKLLFVFAFLMCCAVRADAAYAPLTVQMITDVNLTAGMTVKGSTTAKHVTKLLHTDAGGLMIGIVQKTVTTGNAATILALQGVASSVISDGTGAISVGDLVDISNTVDGELMKCPTTPTPDSNTVCTALTAAAATPGTVFTCL